MLFISLVHSEDRGTAKIAVATELKLKEALKVLSDPEDMRAFYDSLNAADPYIRAAASSQIFETCKFQAFFPRADSPSDEAVNNRLAKLIKDPMPIVRLMASRAYLWRTFGGEDVQTAVGAVSQIVDLLNCTDAYVSDQALEACGEIESLQNFRENQEVWVSFKTALRKKAEEIKNPEKNEHVLALIRNASRR